MSKIIYFFRDKGLIDEVNLLKENIELVIEIQNAIDNKSSSRTFEISLGYQFNSFQRMIVHLVAEANHLYSWTETIPLTCKWGEPGHICLTRCKTYAIDTYKKGKRVIMVSRENPELSNRNRAKKNKIYFERKRRCIKLNKERSSLGPL